MKKLLIFSFILFTAALFTGCSGNDDEVESAEAGVYDLTLRNNTGSQVTIFLKEANLTFGYQQKGSISAGGEMVLENLAVRQSYAVRASLTQNPSEFFYEEIVFQESPTDVTLLINN